MPVGNPGALFQRRQYDRIAQVIANLGCVDDFTRRNIATEFALMLSGTNSAFNRERFISACMAGREATQREPYVAPVVQVPEVPPVPALSDWEQELLADVAPVTVVTCDWVGGCDEIATHICPTNRPQGTDSYYCDGHARPGDCSRCTPLPTN